MVSPSPKFRELRYMQVANYLRKKILVAEYKPGDCLPGQQKLAKELNISFATLKRALDILDQEGYVSRKAGHGTFVTLPKKHNPAALVMDDDETVRRFLIRVLENRGWQIVVAESSQMAVEKFKKQQFDLAFLDLAMSGMKGVEVFGEIRKLNPQVQVAIAISNVDPTLTSQVFQQALQVGLFTVIRKPITLYDLTMVIQNVAIGAKNHGEYSRFSARHQVV